MTAVPEQRPERKTAPPDINIDVDLRERAALLIARRFALSLAVATVLADAAGLGGARQ
jgi:hypothetical protein